MKDINDTHLLALYSAICYGPLSPIDFNDWYFEKYRDLIYECVEEAIKDETISLQLTLKNIVYYIGFGEYCNILKVNGADTSIYILKTKKVNSAECI